MTVRGWVRAWAPAILWASLIWGFSTQSFSAENTASAIEQILRWIHPSVTRNTIGLLNYAARKSAHFIEFLVFCLLLFRGLRGEGKGWRWTWALGAFAAAAGYAALDEIHQSFVAGRTASPYDSLLDSTGALMAMIACWLWSRRKLQRAAATPPAIDVLP